MDIELEKLKKLEHALCDAIDILRDWQVEEVKPECPCADGIDSKACVGCEHSEDGKREYKPYVTVDEFILAGLKAGRPKWHKVADGDLPNTEREVLVFMWGSYYLGYYKQYDGEDSSWHFTDFDEESEQIVAWCEIPQYTEE